MNQIGEITPSLTFLTYFIFFPLHTQNPPTWGKFSPPSTKRESSCAQHVLPPTRKNFQHRPNNSLSLSRVESKVFPSQKTFSPGIKWRSCAIFARMLPTFARPKDQKDLPGLGNVSGSTFTSLAGSCGRGPFFHTRRERVVQFSIRCVCVVFPPSSE